MRAQGSSNGARRGTGGLEDPETGSMDRSRRQERLGPFWRTLSVLGLVAMFLVTLQAAALVTETWQSSGTPALEHPVALFEAHQADRGGDLSNPGSVQGRTGLVLRLLRGEPAEAVAAESHVPVRELERWERRFMAAGQRGLHGEDAETPQGPRAPSLH